MKTYRRITLLTVLFAIIVAGSLPFLKSSDANQLTVDIIGGAAVIDLMATLYLLLLTLKSRLRPRSWLLITLFTAAALVTAGLLFISSVLFFPPGTYAPGIGRLLIGMGAILIGGGPALLALTILLVRGNPQVAEQLIDGKGHHADSDTDGSADGPVPERA